MLGTTTLIMKLSLLLRTSILREPQPCLHHKLFDSYTAGYYFTAQRIVLDAFISAVTWLKCLKIT